MKKDLLITAFCYSLGFLLMVSSITSCTKERLETARTLEPERAAASTERGKVPSGPAEVFLKVTVNNSGNNITSDGAGDYVNGSQSVSARFDTYGNFIFSCGLGGQGKNTYLIRWMNINFSSPVVIYSNPPITGNDKVTAITTVSAVGQTFTPLQNMSVGQSQCVGLTGGSNSGWVMNFHRGAEDVSTSQSAYAVFTRTSLTQWTVTPAGSCSTNSNICALRNGPDILFGYYNIPFSFTLTKLP